MYAGSVRLITLYIYNCPILTHVKYSSVFFLHDLLLLQAINYNFFLNNRRVFHCFVEIIIHIIEITSNYGINASPAYYRSENMTIDINEYLERKEEPKKKWFISESELDDEQYIV